MKNRLDTTNRCILRLLAAASLICTAMPAAANNAPNTRPTPKELHIPKEPPISEGVLHPTVPLPPTDTLTANSIRKVEVSFGTDLMSSYVCRGSYQAGPSFQPSFTASYGGLIFSAWGSVDFTGSQMLEVNLSIGYRYRTFEVLVSDYYIAPLGTANGRLFRFDRSGPHTFELSFSWTPSRRIPIGIWWGTTFAGADVANDGRRNFSSYAEISYPFNVRKVIDMKTGIGFMPWSTENCFNTYGFAVTNVFLHASKQWTLRGNLRLGILARLICNPYREQLNFVGGVSLYI